jgi:hypothetical protein
MVNVAEPTFTKTPPDAETVPDTHADTCAAALLLRLDALGIMCWSQYGAIRFRPRSAVPDDLAADIRANTPAITALLATRPNRRALPRPPRRHLTAEEKTQRRMKRALARHCGGNPSPTQVLLIDEIVRLSTIVARMDKKIADGDADHGNGASRRYLAYSNSLSRALGRLGLDAVPEPAPTLDELVAGITRNAPAPHVRAPLPPVDEDDGADDVDGLDAFSEAAE